jgi:signal transduction histidine kinase
MLTAVAALSVIVVSTDEPVTYLVFPALIWAALRFGPPGATLSVAIAAGLAIGVTANDLGPFSNQAIDHRTLSTQAYIAVAALTTLLLCAVVSERERSASDLAEVKRREGEQALDERHRIARELHDSVSQALFSTVLHTRTAQKTLEQGDGDVSRSLERELNAIGELTRSAQNEMRTMIFELGRDPVEDGLVAALAEHVSRLSSANGLTIAVEGPEPCTKLPRRVETQLFGIGREALGNVVKHADARTARVLVENSEGHVVLEITDDGRGFDPGARHPGHFGLESMRSRANEIGGTLTISSTPGAGTVVRIEVPAQAEGPSDDA